VSDEELAAWFSFQPVSMPLGMVYAVKPERVAAVGVEVAVR
jgi:hypothetical protein